MSWNVSVLGFDRFGGSKRQRGQLEFGTDAEDW